MALPPGHLIDPFGATTAAVCINTPSRHHHQQQQPTTTTTTTTPDTTTNNATECDSAAPVPDAGNSHTTNANVPPPFQNTPYAPAQPLQQQSTTAIAEGAAAADPSWPEPNANYLAQLIKDKRQITSLPNMFLHVDRLLDKEISNVREKLMQKQNTVIGLPEPEGQIVTVSQKLYIPVDEHPDFNFIGRILGPRGMTAKQLESETGCKIMVRGKGSIRDRAKEEQMKDKPNWQHLSDNLHVLITCEDYENRAGVKLKSAAEKVSRLLEPKPEGEDELKKRQLIELAKLNGTYRDNSFYSQLVASLARFQFMPPNILSSMVELPSHLSASAVPPAYPHQQHQVVNALAAAAAAAAAANVSGSSVFVTSADPGSFVKLRKDLLVRSLANPPSHPLLSAEPPQRSSYIDPGTILQNAAFVNPALFYIPTQQQQPHATDATSLNGLITPTTSAAAANTNYSHVTTAANNNHRTDTCCDNSSTSSSSSTTDTMNTCFNDINSGTTNTGPIRHPTNNSHQRPVPPSLLLQPSFQQQQPRGLGSVQTHYHQWIRQQTHPYNRPENQC